MTLLKTEEENCRKYDQADTCMIKGKEVYIELPISQEGYKDLCSEPFALGNVGCGSRRTTVKPYKNTELHEARHTWYYLLNHLNFQVR
ncbi:MAG: hypothetical protein LBE09_07055 [Christensenellaceae bacterium]|nr:hypothetical protein [Christensenellaceae bacterium]